MDDAARTDWIHSFNTRQERIDAICERYSAGEDFFKGLDARDMAEDILEYAADVPRFHPWLVQQLTDEEINADYLDRKDAWELAMDAVDSDDDPERAAELATLAEKIDDFRNKDPRPKVEQLGLTEDELDIAIDHATNEILESGTGWRLLSTISLVAKNAWQIQIQVTASDRGEDWSVRAIPPSTRKALEHPERFARTERNFLSRADRFADWM